MRVSFFWLSVDMTFVLATLHLPGSKNENLSQTECIEGEKADIYFCFDLQKNRMGLKAKALETRL